MSQAAEIKSDAPRVLYVSAGIARTHPLHCVYRATVDRPPDLDLNRIVSSCGSAIRRHFYRAVVDATAGADALPSDLSPFAGIAIGGSVHCWAEERRPLESWQTALVDFSRRAIDAQLPFLGLCGGAQVGLLALGGSVRPNHAIPGRDVGQDIVRTTDVSLTDAGLVDRIFIDCPPRISMQEVHADYLADLPSGTVLLGHSIDMENQVVAMDAHVRLFQPHPELTATDLGRILESVARATPDASRARAFSAAASELGETLVANRMIVNNFLRHFCGIDFLPNGE